MHILDELKAREFIYDVTDEDGLREAMSAGPITYYTGYDPTNTSLTVGNLVPLMLQAHIARAGHKPIVILGGGTALVGDPSGKSKTREHVLSRDDIAANLESQRPQFERFLGEATLVDNADWLCELNYIEFLRDIGRHFSVNEMIKAETYAARLRNEQHLSFVEFNYRLVQAYDFLHLYREHGCVLQTGGQDQWGNCVAGTELIRKVTGGKAWVLTNPLLLKPDGTKMGKTETGAVWLDAGRTPPYAYFQYWLNVEDSMVDRLLKWFTFLPLEEIAELAGGPIHRSKATLAFEATALCHGLDEAAKALATSMLLFGLERYVAWEDVAGATERPPPDIPTASVSVGEGIAVFKLFVAAGLAGSGKQAKQLVQQGGAYLDGVAQTDPFETVAADRGTLLLRAGKKKYCLVTLA
jgi:tyrosyl-tRNA synthetase